VREIGGLVSSAAFFEDFNRRVMPVDLLNLATNRLQV
jgi:hypothetical protein